MEIISSHLAAFFITGAILFGLSETRTVCYSLVGGDGVTCFSNYPPFDNANGNLPESPRQVGTNFVLFTRRGNEQIYTDGLAISRYLQKRETKVLIHGYRSNIGRWVVDAAALLLQLGNYNIIAVDWSPGAGNRNYFKSVANARLVGAQIGLLVTALEETYGITPSDVHIIGHSLGAQTAGYAGKGIPELGRISALDPAGPAFYNNNPRVRISPNDAMYVDVLHTNGDTSLSGGLGLLDPVGTADFYANGGKDQPGCDSNLCSHNRAIDIYMETIVKRRFKRRCTFTAYPCEPGNLCRPCGRKGCASAGYYSLADGACGSYYLPTTAEPPYCNP